MPYEKVRIWADFPLRDKRVKSVANKKVLKTFRLDPAAVKRLREIVVEKRCTETEVVEKLIFGSGGRI
jgi:hypothetical protein